MRTILAVVSDLHAGSRRGLCPPEVELDSGDDGQPAKYHASRTQLELWRSWCDFWQIVAQAKKRCRAKRVIAVVAGDGVDDNNFSKAELISANKSDLLHVAAMILEPMRNVADLWYMVRGTEFHTGKECWLEEQAAKQCHAAPNEEAQTCSWYYLPLEVEGVHIHIAHKPPTSGWLPWTKGAAPSRVSAALVNWYIEMNADKLPDIAFFGHVHYAADSGLVVKPRVLFCPGWQATTTYAAQRGQAGIVRPVGGWWLVCEDGKYREPQLELFHWRREVTWQAIS